MGREKQKRSQLGTTWDQIPFLVLLLKTSIILSLCSINFQSALSNHFAGGGLRDGLDEKNPMKMIGFFLISIFKTSCHPHNQAELHNPFLWGFSQALGSLLHFHDFLLTTFILLSPYVRIQGRGGALPGCSHGLAMGSQVLGCP